MSSSAKEIAPFLRNLRRMLDTEHASIICWTSDGVAFEIHDLPRLVERVLPKYFKHAKYSSFQRQLNYFHFRKWTRSKTAVCTFSNPHFQRDAPELAWRISRKKSLPSTANSTVSVKKPSLTIAVPKTEGLDLDGHKSPTDASAMVHHHAYFSQPPEIRCAPVPGVNPWAVPVSPSLEDVAMPLEGDASFDWIDSLYSSLDGEPRPENLGILNMSDMYGL